MNRPRNPHFSSHGFGQQQNFQSHAHTRPQSNANRRFSRPRARSRGSYQPNTYRFNDQRNLSNNSAEDAAVTLNEGFSNDPNYEQQSFKFQQFDNNQKQNFSFRNNEELSAHSFSGNTFNANQGQVPRTIPVDTGSFQSKSDIYTTRELPDDVNFFKNVQVNFVSTQTGIPGLDVFPEKKENYTLASNSVKGSFEQHGGFESGNVLHSQGHHFMNKQDGSTVSDYPTNTISYYVHPEGTNMQQPPPNFLSNMQQNTFQNVAPRHQGNIFQASPQQNFTQRGLMPPIRFPPPEQQARGQQFYQPLRHQSNISMQHVGLSQSVQHLGSSQSIQQLGSSQSIQNLGQSQPCLFVEEAVSQNTYIGHEQDIQWINNWLIRKGRQETKTDHPISSTVANVYEVQEKTKRMMFLMASLQKQLRLLSSCDKSQFDGGTRTVADLKREMESIRKYLSTINTDLLRKKVVKRAQKRERLKRQRQEKHDEKQRALEHRQQRHKEIDQRLHQIYQVQADKRQQKELKKQADKILSEVRKKTQDVTRATDLLKNLQKLRKLRKDRLIQQGVHSKPEAEEDFEDKVKDCLEVLRGQKEVYNAENKALRVMMETEQEETKEKEREKKRLILHNQEMKKQKKDDRLLFGEPVHMDMDDSMFVFRQYYDQANLRMDSLIQIRCDWDRFLVNESTPGGSRIPDGFVIPVKPSSDVWASAVKEDT